MTVFMLREQTISVNGKAHRVPVDYPLTALLKTMHIDPETARGIAIAVNEDVVRRKAWPEVILHANDSVEIVTAQQGG